MGIGRHSIAGIIRQAGMEPWRKLFQNLRSTRQTELSIQGYATHVVCAWIGNTEAVANKHYFQVPDSEFDRAAGAKALDSKQAHQALQNPVQQAAVSGGMGEQAQQTGLVFAEKYEALPFGAVYQAPTRNRREIRNSEASIVSENYESSR